MTQENPEPTPIKGYPIIRHASRCVDEIIRQLRKDGFHIAADKMQRDMNEAWK